MGLENKVILIAGMGTIGQGVARVLAKDKAQIVLMGHTQAKMDKVSEEIKAMNGKVDGVQVNVLDYHDVLDKVGQIKEKYGRIDGCVVTVGGKKFSSPIDQYPEGEMEKMMNLNFLPVYYLFRAVLPIMEEQKYGRLICFDSTHGGIAGDGGYGVGKAAMMSLVKTIAVECAKYNITCNAILPGIVMSDLTRAITLPCRTAKKR